MNKTHNYSSLDSFFFQLRPNYFQLEHSFAKNMKSGTNYRLQIFKGIQKISEMSQPIKAKLVGGKIILDSIGLNFYLALFNPVKNISFALVLLESRPQQEQIQIAKHIINSSNYILKLLNEGKSVQKEDVQLVNGFKLNYQLFVSNSKLGLTKSIEQYQLREQGRARMLNSPFNPNKGGYATDTFSQSDASQSCQQGTPPNFKKKLSRRRGHQGKLKLKNVNNQSFSQREISLSSNNYLGANKDCDQSFMNGSNLKFGQQNIKKEHLKKENLVSLTRRDSNASQILIQFQPNLSKNEVSCMEKIQFSHSQIIQSKKEEKKVNKFSNQIMDLFCGLEDVNQSTISCSHNKSSHKISIKTRESFDDIPCLKLKPSMQRHVSTTSDAPQQSAKLQFESVKQVLFYIFFSVISIFLLYHAISPSRRV